MPAAPLWLRWLPDRGIGLSHPWENRTEYGTREQEAFIGKLDHFPLVDGRHSLLANLCRSISVIPNFGPHRLGDFSSLRTRARILIFLVPL